MHISAVTHACTHSSTEATALFGQIKTCVMQVPDWPQIWDSSLYTMLFIGSMLLLQWAVREREYGEDSDCIWTLTMQTYPNSASPLSWSDLNYWYELLFYPGCQGNVWRSKQGSLQIWVVKGIMWQLQITMKNENKTSQLLTTCCLTSFFPKPKEGGTWLWVSFKLPSSLQDFLSHLQGFPWNTESLADKTFFF